MRAPALLAALALALAGCLAAPAAPPPGVPAPEPGPVEIVSDRPEPTFNEVATGPAAAPDLDATLDRAPRWVPGEWWRIRFHSPLDGSEAEYVRVVAAVQDGDYVVGMPHEGWYKEAVIYHAPAFGDVHGDLSYDTHDELFVPVKFPLTEDQAWTTSFSGGPATAARVTVDGPQEATVAFTPEGQEEPLLTLVYDSRIHEVREFRHPTVEYEVLEHGYGFEGWVTVPRGEDLVFIHGRAFGLLGIPGGDPNPAPSDTVAMEGGYNRVTFVHIAGSFGGPTGQVPPLPGVFRTRAVSPDGQEFVTENVLGGGLEIAFFEHPSPDGTWTLEHTAVGNGIAFIEGIAYHQYDIHLPTGGKRADHAHEVIR